MAPCEIYTRRWVADSHAGIAIYIIIVNRGIRWAGGINSSKSSYQYPSNAQTRVACVMGDVPTGWPWLDVVNCLGECRPTNPLGARLPVASTRKCDDFCIQICYGPPPNTARYSLLSHPYPSGSDSALEPRQTLPTCW